MNITQAVLNKLGYRNLSQVTTVIIHHSVANKTTDIEDIDRMEKVSQGFIVVGYHEYLKCVDTEKDLWVAQTGRPITAIPAAAYGMNTQSYDICIGGNYEPGGAPFLDEVSEKSLVVAAAQIAHAKQKLPNLKYLIGHYRVAQIKAKQGLNPGDYSTACPGKGMVASLNKLRSLCGLEQYPGFVGD